MLRRPRSADRVPPHQSERRRAAAGAANTTEGARAVRAPGRSLRPHPTTSAALPEIRWCGGIRTHRARARGLGVTAGKKASAAAAARSQAEGGGLLTRRWGPANASRPAAGDGRATPKRADATAPASRGALAATVAQTASPRAARRTQPHPRHPQEGGRNRRRRRRNNKPARRACLRRRRRKPPHGEPRGGPALCRRPQGARQ